MKKHILLCIWMVVGTVILEAQAPEKFSYQAVIRDASNELVVNASVGLRITIQQGMTGGTEVYQETHSEMTNINGLVSLEVGGGTSTMMGDFGDINWGEGPFYIQTEIDPTGGTDYSIMGTTELISVPYALHAGNVKKYKIGDVAQGGIVFYVEPCGTKGLVAALEDQSVSIKWRGGSTDYTTLAMGDEIYGGKMNTSISIAVHSAKDDFDDHAALVCANYTGSGYGDWYLPSKAELALMFSNIGQGSSMNIGGFANGSYWSSTEASSGTALFLFFFDGSDGTTNKSGTFRVRAIRSF